MVKYSSYIHHIFSSLRCIKCWQTKSPWIRSLLPHQGSGRTQLPSVRSRRALHTPLFRLLALCKYANSNISPQYVQECSRIKISLCSSQTPTCWTRECGLSLSSALLYYRTERWMAIEIPVSTPTPFPSSVSQVNQFTPGPRQCHHPGAALRGRQHARSVQCQLFSQCLRQFLQRYAR